MGKQLYNFNKKVDSMLSEIKVFKTENKKLKIKICVYVIILYF